LLAEQSLREGGLDESLTQLQEQVRKDPSNAKYRVFLFQLLAVLGQWDRAFNQLKVAGELDAGTLAMVQPYREALRCEVLRQGIFAGRGAPLVFGQPERWIALLIEALRLAAAGDDAAAKPLREEAFELAPATSGVIDGQPFEWIADADPRLGPVVEAVVNGAYYWVPFHLIRTLRIEEPADLRDLVWMPAQFTWANGGGSVGLIPTRYPGSESNEDAQIRLCRRTEWLERDPEFFIGLGQRMLATDGGEYPLMEIREISLNASQSSDPAEAGAGASDG